MEQNHKITLNVLYTFTDKGRIPDIKRLGKACQGKCNWHIFVDSGAFTAYSKGATIEIDDYIEHIYEHKKYLYCYANLDVINRPKESAENLRIMKESGLFPMPVIHYGTSVAYMRKIAEEHDYIGLGCFNKGTLGKEKELQFSRRIMQICREVRPDARFHAFGVSDPKLIYNEDWFSADHTNWAAGFRGDVRLYHPGTKKLYEFDRTSMKGLVKRYRFFKELFDLYGIDKQSLIQGKGWVPLKRASILSFIDMQEEVIRRKQKPFLFFFASMNWTYIGGWASVLDELQRKAMQGVDYGKEEKGRSASN